MILSLLVYVSYAILFVFAVVCLAAGLFYIAELVEEYTMITKRIIQNVIVVIGLIHILLMIFDDLPFMYLTLGLISHGSYFLLLKEFPFIAIFSPKSLVAIVCIILDHGLWFYYFTQNYREFHEIVAFFVICVWLVPFIYFISLSANDSTLPYGIISSSGEEVNAEDFTYPLGGKKRGKRTSSFLILLNWLRRKKDEILPQFSPSGQKMF